MVKPSAKTSNYSAKMPNYSAKTSNCSAKTSNCSAKTSNCSAKTSNCSAIPKNPKYSVVRKVFHQTRTQCFVVKRTSEWQTTQAIPKQHSYSACFEVPLTFTAWDIHQPTKMHRPLCKSKVPFNLQPNIHLPTHKGTVFPCFHRFHCLALHSTDRLVGYEHGLPRTPLTQQIPTFEPNHSPKQPSTTSTWQTEAQQISFHN